MGRRLTKWSGRDRCHSGGFLLRIMPPSWQPVPACTRNGHSAGGQFINAATTAAGGPFYFAAKKNRIRRGIVAATTDVGGPFYFAAKKNRIRRGTVAATTCRRRAILLAGTIVLHRFLISSSNLRIDAAKKLNLVQSVHRFLISGPDLRIDATKRPKQGQSVHRFLISSPNLRIDAAQRSKPE